MILLRRQRRLTPLSWMVVTTTYLETLICFEVVELELEVDLFYKVVPETDR